MVLVQNKYKNTLVGVLRTQITFVTHSSPSIRLNSGNLSPQKTDSGVFIILSKMFGHEYKATLTTVNESCEYIM